MGDAKGFLKIKRQDTGYRPVCDRKKDYKDVAVLRSDDKSAEQASRCMDCGTPFCHWACPISNYIPEWNDFLFKKDWRKALELLLATNNLPEITGRLCPALCEYSCVLGINDDAVTIKENELSIIEYAFKNNLIKPKIITHRTGKKVAVIGSGPSGITCADQLNKAGHKVIVFERDKNVGGIMRYGIPDFKLEKNIIERRINILKKEGIEFKTQIEVGKHVSFKKIMKEFDAVCLCCGSRVPRDLKIEGRELKGIYFAMDYLTQANKKVSKEKINDEEIIDVKDKKVVVIGGGDTGSDCVGTANRQGAKCVIQIELLDKPPECRNSEFPWPIYPLLLKTSSSHEEGAERMWAILTKRFVGQNGYLNKLSCVKVDFSQKNSQGCPIMREISGSEFEIEADIVILSMGFLHPEKKGLLEQMNVELDKRGNVKTNESYMTSVKGIFSCGDMRTGQSLIVWAIQEARQASKYINKYLTNKSI